MALAACTEEASEAPGSSGGSSQTGGAGGADGGQGGCSALGPWYRDEDGDGYGDAALPTQACEPPSGHVADDTDCADDDPQTYPGATPQCDGVDHDCDGLLDCALFVDVDGVGGPCSDQGPGTQDEPWCSVPHAFDQVSPGDTVYLRGGTYLQAAPLGDALADKHGTAQAPIRFVGFPGEEAIVTSMRPETNPATWSLVTGNVYALTINSIATATVSNVSQDGIPLRYMPATGSTPCPQPITGEGQWCRASSEVHVWARGGGNPGDHAIAVSELPHSGGPLGNGNPMYASTIHLRPGNDHFHFEQLTIEGGYYPLFFEAAGGAVRHSVVRNCFGDAIKAGGVADGGAIEGNDIYAFGESGVDITGGDYWHIADNRIHDNADNRVDGTKANGIMLKNHNVGTIVERNRIYRLDSRYGALTLGGATTPVPVGEGVGLVARNNLMFDIATVEYCVLFMGCQDCSLVHNLIAGCCTGTESIAVLSSSTGPEYASSYAKIANNIFVGATTGRTVTIQTGNAHGLQLDHNLYDAAPTYRVEGTDLTFAQMSQAGWEVSSVVAAPLFVDDGNADYHLLPGSPGVDQGYPQVGWVVEDFEGTPRPQGAGWDMGPYER